MENDVNADFVTAANTRKSDSCGCAMGARLMGMAFCVSLIFYGWQLFKNETSLTGLLIKTFFITFVAAGLGKLIGISLYRFKKHQTS